MVLNFLVEDLAFVVHGYTVSKQIRPCKKFATVKYFYRVG